MGDQPWFDWFWVAATFGAIAVSQPALAQPSQIVPDNTLGSRSSVVIPNAEGLPLERLVGGDQRGGNLFHSFLEFNVSNGRAAYFDQPQGVINILSRVTGKNSSQILGTLGVIGSANLFFINPNGIIFGPNASLDVGGAFVASTANAIRLGENGLFSASDPDSSNLLSIQPSALFFNALGQPKSIVNQSTATSNVLGQSLNGDPQRAIYGLQVLDGQPLLLVGGPIRLPGGVLTALDGRVELAAIGGPGNVGLSGQGQTLRLSLPANLPRADISLSNQAAVYVTGQGTGAIAIVADNLSLTQGSLLYAGIYSGGTSAPSSPGDIQINTTQNLTLEAESGIFNPIGNNLTPGARAGNILIDTGNLKVVNAAIGSFTESLGDSGNVIIQAQNAVILNGGSIFSTVDSGGVGNAGQVTIAADSLALSNGAYLSSSTFGQGNAGRITIQISDAVALDGVSGDYSSAIFSTVEQGAVGNGGSIDITAKSLGLTNGALLSASTWGIGNAGNITLRVAEAVALDGVGSNTVFSNITSDVNLGAIGQGGNIDIAARSLSLTNGAFLSASTLGTGNAGNITLRVAEAVALDGVSGKFSSAIFSTVEQGAVGDGGNINIAAKTLSLTNGAALTVDISGQGNAGTISLEATDAIAIDGVGSNQVASGVYSSVRPAGIGQGGNINITAKSLMMTNGGSLRADTFGHGNAGNITLQATAIAINGINGINLASGAFSTVGAEAVGNGGRIDIYTKSLALTNGAALSSSTFGRGNAGNITIQAMESVRLDGTSAGFSSTIFSTVEQGAVGNGGNINITAKSLSLTNGAALAGNTFANGSAGNIFVQASDAVRLDGVGQNGVSSAIFSDVSSEAVGNGGNINITAKSLSLTNGAALRADTFGQGNAGNILIQTTDAVWLEGVGSNGVSSRLLTQAEPGSIGRGGNITIATGDFQVSKGAVVNAQTSNSDPGGNITITAKTFAALEGGQLLTTTSSSGQAGSINLQISDHLTLAGSDRTFQARLAQYGPMIVTNQGAASGLFANTAPGSSGAGGSIVIDPDQMILRDGATITVDSRGTGNAGNLSIQAGNLLLDNGASLSAATASGEGGNIWLNVANLLQMRQNSLISAEAQGTGNGGNIDLNTRFLVAIGNSDIVANAFEGRGGSIQITAQGIFGIQARDFLTPLSDINASSQFGIDGVVQVNTTVDPSSGLTVLPSQVIDASSLIAQGCRAVGSVTSKLVVSGRDGLPTNPGDLLSTELVLLDLGQPEVSLSLTYRSKANYPQPKNQAEPIVEAESWVIRPDGKVVLTAQNGQAQPTWFIPLLCPPD
ncbi:MAG: filamentous hemagglutinin N-terminal domain-containing protein [Aphanocapsa sp. GSE-SYN-MK-11-07L]|jgi:filamentous hemagglutinin family protein|nr:filamentous hemagglutinin N-terminal domain-containing protein [Aphanocapsa sp. GSE-SYN-MK-11-07L]